MLTRPLLKTLRLHPLPDRRYKQLANFRSLDLNQRIHKERFFPSLV